MCSLQPYVVLFLIAFNKYLLLNLYKSLFFIIYRSKQLVPKKTHQSNVDKKLQEQFQNLMLLVCKQQTAAENVNNTAAVDQVEDFLTEHLEKLDINQFNREGRTALQQSCLEGNLPLAKVLVKFGANSRIMTREGFSTLHLAVFSGHSHLMSYVMSLR